MYRNTVFFYQLSSNIHILHTNKIDYGTCEHTHLSWTFGIVINGIRRLRINRQNIEVNNNMYYLIPPNCPHQLLQGTCRTETIVISFNQEDSDNRNIDYNLYRGYSREHRIRKIKINYGLPPARFERQEKIRHATKLLLEGYSQSYISNESGFYDQAHFCRCFKALWGITPKEFLTSKK